MVIVYPAFKFAQMRYENNAESLYIYKFSYESEFNVFRKAIWLGDYKGATHIEDVTFIFRVNSIIGDKELSANWMLLNWMTSFITNFMKCKYVLYVAFFL